MLLLFRSLVTASLSTVLNQNIAKMKEDHVIHLLKVYYLLHLLQDKCVHSEQLTVRPSAIDWTSLTGPLRGIEHMMYYKKGSVSYYCVLFYSIT